jgi:hypothetical protein
VIPSRWSSALAILRRRAERAERDRQALAALAANGPRVAAGAPHGRDIGATAPRPTPAAARDAEPVRKPAAP